MSNKIRVAFGGSAADPPHNGHIEAVRLVRNSGKYDLVIWYPSGYSREFKSNLSDAVHRSTMSAILAFPQDWFTNPTDGGCILQINVADVYHDDIPTYLRMLSIREYYRRKGIEAEVTFFTGSDAVTPESDGRLAIEHWAYAPELLKQPILILPRKGFAQQGDVKLPNTVIWMQNQPMEIASSEIRRMIAEGNPDWKELVPPRVCEYIELFSLYRKDGSQNGPT